jgi:hypothetical protein
MHVATVVIVMSVATVVIVEMGTDDVSNARCYYEHIVLMIFIDSG